MASSPHATVFADPRYVEAMCPVWDQTARVESTEQVQSILATQTRATMREVVLPAFTPYSSLLLPELSESSVHAGDDALADYGRHLATRYQRIRLHLPPTLADARPLQLLGWTVSPLYTYCLDVTKGTSAWSSGSRRTARKHESEFVVGIDDEATGDAIHLLLDGYRRQGRPAPASHAKVLEAVRRLSALGMAECATAAHKGEVKAAIVLLHGPEASYYWLAGSLPGPAMTVLLSWVLGHLAERGVATLDMVGANTPSIAEFKRRLGAELVPYWAATTHSGLMARGLAAARALLGR